MKRWIAPFVAAWLLLAHGPLVSGHEAIPDGPAAREALRRHIEESWRSAQENPAAPSQSALPVKIAAQGPAQNQPPDAPPQAAPFQGFLPAIELSWDASYLNIASDGLPAHPMMIGITAWQQQVPLPQAYSGANSWRIPLHPKPASQPAMIEGRFLRGAIALAVNGIPIFNPQNNRGEISYEIGELDRWGGHCGRADDYHYHIAPLHLQTTAGKGQPIAFALDGYPIFGLTEPDDSPVTGLDACHGHEDPKLGYHYHASMKYPYVIGGFHGEVVEADGQVDPQPRATPVREALPALRGAEVSDFAKTGDNAYELSYTLNGETRQVRYRIEPDGTYPFEFDNGRDGVTKEVYQRRPGGGGGPSGGGPGEPRGQKGGRGKGPRGGGMRNDSPPPPPPPRPADAGPAQRSADLNADGFVSAQEFATSAKRDFESAPRGSATLSEAMSKARETFQKLDRNRNGKLEPQEWQAAPAPPPAPSAVTSEPPAPMQSRSSDGKFLLTSPRLEDGARMPVEFTGDGSGGTPPLTWSSPPQGTTSYALIMDHIDKDGMTKWYWTLYDLPGTLTQLPEAASAMGKTGTNFKGRVGYEPPHSQGPGEKTYTITLYALAAAIDPGVPPDQVDRNALLAAMQGKILASSSLRMVHASGEGAQPPPDRKPPGPGKPQEGLVKPTLGDTMKLNVYADNWFLLYVNGRLVAVDPIQFTPHNVVSVDFLPEYPMTIAVLAKDNADPKTGMEYGTSIGDGGFVLKFADGTVTDGTWKAKCFFHGPENADTSNPKITQEPLPENWWSVDFDDRSWPNAKEYTTEEVDPKQPYFDTDFEGAKFIWSPDLALDNTVIFRKRVEKPGWTPRWNTKPDLDVTRLSLP
ncbi:MAG: putative conserved protein, phosphatidylethanolamine-binding protein (PEBP) family [Verrucomicrobia bacterium]|nr:MAG: putative conserved protein, phosphatidylethanolamine-binding protein (PEBP) family [Verrucomicrobiota bacterium]